jgi:tripartite-type tricarboxylate transporter receptor subunit TctC
MPIRHPSAMFGLVLASALSSTAPAHAQTVADFYRGKTVTLLVGVGAGGEYDVLTRLLARHTHRIAGT